MRSTSEQGRPMSTGTKKEKSLRRAMVACGVLLVTLGLVLGGCGETKPTRAQVREKRINDPVRRESVSARVGDVRLQAVRIERPQGGSSPGGNSAMFLSLSNSGADD